MSLLSQFLKAAHSSYAAAAGSQTLSIAGGVAIAGTLGEASFSRDYESEGFEQSGSLEFTTHKDVFALAYPLALRLYEGKSAVARGERWRVQSLTQGNSFVKISLVPENKSA